MLEYLAILFFFRLQKVVILIKLLIILIKAALICSNKVSMAHFVLEQILMHLEQNPNSFLILSLSEKVHFVLPASNSV